MTSTTLNSVLQKDKAGLQELSESLSDFDQDGVSLYSDSLEKKETEGLDNLDDSLCGDEDMKENECLVPSQNDLTQVTSSNSIAEQLANGEQNCSLVDELFDDPPVASQTANSSIANTLNESFDKKIAPSFSSTKAKKRFRAPVQSVVEENKSKVTDEGTRAVAKAKPVFKSGTKASSIGKKRKQSETSNNGDDKASKPPVKALKSDKLKCNQPANADEKVNLNCEEEMDMSSNEKVISSTTNKEAKKASKKKRQKAIEGEEEPTGLEKATVCEQPDKEKTVDAKTVKAKPTFKPNAKKQNPPETSKDNEEKDGTSDTTKQKSDNAEATEVNFNTKEGATTSSNDSIIKLTPATSKGVSSTAEKTIKKKKQKKASEDNEATDNGTKKIKEGKKVDASMKKTVQQQAKIDKSFKNLSREQRKAEKELQKLSRDFEKAKKQKSSKDKKMVETHQRTSSSGNRQLWVQCDHLDCLKWRRLRDCNNPSEIPEEWFCSMNPDEQFNSCDVPEEEGNELSDSQEYVYASFTPGAIVWAKITGYPWWPAMVQDDTNKDTFYEKHPSCHTPIAYHVVFFGKPVSRAWVHSLCLQAFLPDEDPNTKVPQKYKSPLTAAVREADTASQVSVEERLAQYSFDKLYTGKSMYVDDQWASDKKERRKRKVGAPKKIQQCEEDNKS